jgi:versiconal hemiacetal acetate esterase
VGGRLLLHGSVSEILAKYEKIGATLVSKLTFPSPDASVTTKDLTIRPGLQVRIYTPENYKGDRPVCVFYHGGGWAMGDLDGEDIQVRKICRDAGVVIVSVDYRLAPQHPYPAPLEDCVFAYNWALENTKMLRTTSGVAAVYGTSAGGNLALATALKIVDDGKGNTLVGVVAVVPVTVAPACVPEKLRSSYTSYDEHAEHTINTKSAMEGFFGKLDTLDQRPNADLRCRCIWRGWKRSLRLAPPAQKVERSPQSLPRSFGT